MTEENKIFDVALPGSSKSETGSKPMVVGHKLIQDPTIKVANTEEPAIETIETISSRSEKTIKPLSQDESKSPIVSKDSVDLANNENATNATVDEVSENVPKENSEETSKTELEASAKNVEEKQKSEDKLEVEREDKLQEMIKSKQYYAPIEEANFSSFKIFFKTFIIVALLGIITLVVLIDAEIIDLGITLPFDFL